MTIRSDTDSWDVASSVGATATMVAAARALASRQPDALIDDPYAVPLVRAVGNEFFVRLAEGEINVAEVDTGGTAALMTTVMAVRTKFFDDFFLGATAVATSDSVDGVGRRGAAELPGPDAQDRLFDNITALSAPGSRLATEQMDLKGSADEWTAMINERSRRVGSDTNLAAPFDADDRNPVAGDPDVEGPGRHHPSWRTAYALTGSRFPEHELIARAGGSGYLSARLK